MHCYYNNIKYFFMEVLLMEKRVGWNDTDAGYRATDRRQIIQENMKYLTPEQSANLYKVMLKVTQNFTPLKSLKRDELYYLFYGHIFTNSIQSDGTKVLTHEEMDTYAEVLADCYSQGFEDIESYSYQMRKTLTDEDKLNMINTQIEEFIRVSDKYEKILGKKARL